MSTQVKLITSVIITMSKSWVTMSLTVKSWLEWIMTIIPGPLQALIIIIPMMISKTIQHVFFCNNNTNKSWQHNSKENCRPGTGNTSKRRKTAPLQTIQPWRIPSSPWRPRLIMIIMLSKRENHPIIPLYNKRWFIVNLNYVISPPKGLHARDHDRRDGIL